jgi:hypothetical protein
MIESNVGMAQIVTPPASSGFRWMWKTRGQARPHGEGESSWPAGYLLLMGGCVLRYPRQAQEYKAMNSRRYRAS